MSKPLLRLLIIVSWFQRIWKKQTGAAIEGEKIIKETVDEMDQIKNGAKESTHIIKILDRGPTK